MVECVNWRQTLKFPLKSGNIYSTGVIGYMSEKYGGVCMAAEHKVVVYSTPTCPWCVRAKDYLKNAGRSNLRKKMFQ
jgi:uncharacterized protein YycO